MSTANEIFTFRSVQLCSSSNYDPCLIKIVITTTLSVGIIEILERLCRTAVDQVLGPRFLENG